MGTHVVMLNIKFTASVQGERNENLDLIGHHSHNDWTLSYLMDGYGDATPHYVHELSNNIKLELSKLNESSNKNGLDILDLAIKSTSSSEGRASVVFVYCEKGKMTILSAGDTRAYIPTDKFITKDHTQLQYLIDTGKKTHTQKNHPLRTILRKSFRKNSDISELEKQIETDIKDVILCTDGFWSELTDIEILDVCDANQLKQLFFSITYTDNSTIIYLSKNE